jgi:Kef-type K+ transport system membrane component KefB
MDIGFLTFILAIAIIIVVAKLGGYVSARFRQPAVLGELLAGILLGPTLFNFQNWLNSLPGWPNSESSS